MKTRHTVHPLRTGFTISLATVGTSDSVLTLILYHCINFVFLFETNFDGLTRPSGIQPSMANKYCCYIYFLTLG